MTTPAAIGRKLTEYRRKRDFHVTAEPRGGMIVPRLARPLCFVIQKHAASHLHYDLRLELAGVMRSWAVPKGPSLDPAVKRLAVEVADHELDAGTLEGPSGGGTTIVWDRGPYEQGGRVPWPQALERGHAVFVLHGQKLRGGFALQRTGAGDKAQWLLIKRRDEFALPGSDVTADRPESVHSGVALGELLGASA